MSDKVERQKKDIDSFLDLEERYKILVENANDAICFISITGRYLFYNSKFLEMFGFTETDMEKITFYDIVHPDDLQVVKKRREERLKGGNVPEKYEYRAITKDGKTLYVETNATLVNKGDTVIGIQTIIRNVTDRKKAEQALRESEEKHRLLVQNVDEIIYIADTIPDPFQSRLSFVSDQVKGIVGYSSKEFLSNTQLWFSIIHPDDVHKVEEDTKKILTDKKKKIRYYRLKHKNKDEYIWLEDVVVPKLDSNGNVIKFFGVARDITERKKAEEALRESEEKFRSLFESASDAIFILDSNGNFIDINRTAYERLGYTKDEMMSLHISQLDPPEFAARVPERIEQVKKHGKAVFESGHLRKDGTVMPVEVNTKIIDFEGEKVFLSVIRDLTERKQAEEEKETISNISKLFITSATLESFYQEVPKILSNRFGFSSAAIELYDEANGNMVFVGMIGIPTKGTEPMRVPIDKTISGTVAKTGEIVLETNASQRPEYQYSALKKLGAETYLGVPMKIGGQVIGVVSLGDTRKRQVPPSFVDTVQVIANYLAQIIERKQAEEELKALKEFNEDIVQTMEEGILIEDEKGIITFVNPKTEELLGYSKDELIGRHWREISSPKYLKKMEKESKKRLKGISSSYEAAILSKTGEETPIIISASPIFENNTFNGVLAVFTDIGDLKKLEQQQIDAKNEAEFYIDLMGHDINNANTIALGLLDLMLGDRSELSEKQFKLISKSLQAVKRSSNLIDSVRKLQMAKVTGEEIFKTMDLSAVLNDAIKETKALHVEKEISVNYKPKKAQIYTDSLVKDLFLNLIDNAAKYDLSDNVNIEIEVEDMGKSWKVGITDHGMGIPDDMKELIFTRFQRIDKGMKGSGIGLHLVKTLTDKYNGKVWVVDRVKGDHSKGSTFYVTLPKYVR